MANRIELEGYVTKDGVRKSYTPSGKVIHWVTVACYEKPKADGTKVVNYLSVKFWDSYIGEKLFSGKHISVWGYVSSWPVKNDEGNIIRTDMAIEAINIAEIIEKPKDNAVPNNPPAGTTPTEPPPDINDEDCPFS